MTDIAPPLHYTLSSNDALAYEKLPRALSGLQRAMLYCWLAIAGVLLIILPPELVGTITSPRLWFTGAAFLLVQWVVYLVVRTLWQRLQARRRYPAPVEVELEQDNDHFAITENGKTRIVNYADIGMILPTAAHLFMAVGHDLVIVPLIAFGDATGMEHMVNTVDTYMQHHNAQEFAGADGIVVTDDADFDGSTHHHHLPPA